MTTAANYPQARPAPHRNVTVARDNTNRRRPGRLASLVRFPSSPERTSRQPAGWAPYGDEAPEEPRRPMLALVQALPNFLLCGALTFIIAQSLGLFSQ